MDETRSNHRRFFCTLFDSHYLVRGLAMAKSLFKNSPGSTLFVICFDDKCFEILKKANLPGLIPIPLAEFEDPELARIKNSRSTVEYFWTCTPSLPFYLLRRYPEIDLITYLDADLLFFSSPETAFELMGEHSILVTPHRYLPEYDRSIVSGIYCVQFVSFRRDERGMEAINWWRSKCNEWCYNYYEDGKFGDQKYLDDWPTRFKGVYVCEHPGVGAAPWNIRKYSVGQKSQTVTIDRDPLVFYHYHSLKIYPGMEINVGDYPISGPVVEAIYRPYREALVLGFRDIRKLDPEFNSGISSRPPRFRYLLHNLKIRMMGGCPVIAE